MSLDQIVDVERYKLAQPEFLESCKTQLDDHGVLALKNFIAVDALHKMQSEAKLGYKKAYFCSQSHNVYLSPEDEGLDDEHPRNRLVVSSKGCICDDLIANNSPLRILYDSPEFRSFITAVTGQNQLHPYADQGQELGWHFDNSSFAITLLIDKPDAGSRFEYIKDLRHADAGEMNYDGVGELLDGQIEPSCLDMEPGTLVLFRGRDSIHRVSPNESEKTRMLAVLAYNSQAGISLSENARLTFYGRLD